MIRLVLADDHAIFREGLAHLLSSDPEIEVVGSTGRGDEALEIIRTEKPDIAILDISMPGLNGIDVSREAAAEALPTRIILLTMHDDPTLAREAIEAGVAGFVVKDNTASDLIDAVHKVSAGGSFLCDGVAEKVRKLDSLTAEPAALSPREREVLRCVALGRTNKEVARDLDISPKTVDTHRTRLMRKLNVHTTADLVRYAVKIGLVR